MNKVPQSGSDAAVRPPATSWMRTTADRIVCLMVGLAVLAMSYAQADADPDYCLRLSDGTSVPFCWLRGEMVVETSGAQAIQFLANRLTPELQLLPLPAIQAASRDGRRFVLRWPQALERRQWLAMAEAWQAEGKVRGVYAVLAHPPSGLRATLNDELMACLRDENEWVGLIRALDSFRPVLVERTASDHRIVRLRLGQGGPFAAMEAAARAVQSGCVQWAEPNFEVEIRRSFLPNDPDFGLLWHLHNTGQSGGRPDADIDAVEAWDTTLGSPAVAIAIIDDGLHIDHPDLRNNIWNNPREIAGNGLDDDFNGYVDDVTGWDFYANDNNPRPDSLSDYHATPCAGMAAAEANNAEGVAGVAPRCKILPCRVLGETNPTLSRLSEAIRYAGVHADVLSMSWSSLPNDTIGAAIQYAATTGRGGLGCVICAAVGNAGSTSTIGFPASHSMVLGIGASTNQDVRAGYSNYATGYGVFLLAPSGDSGFVNPVYAASSLGGYTWFSGTSAATPQAAGAAALVLSVAPTLMRTQVAEVLKQSADKIDPAAANYDASGYSNAYGYGRLNVHRALVAVLPDLAPLAFDFQPETVARDGSLVFSGAVQNLGGVASAPCWLEIWLSNKASFSSLDTLACNSVLMPSLAPGGAFQLSTVDGRLMAGVSDGLYRVGVVVDRLDQQREVSESNNRVYRTDRLLQVGAGSTQADLTVENFDFQPAAVVARDRIGLTGQVVNRGVQMSRGVWVEFWASRSTTGATLDYLLCTSVRVGPLGPGESFDLAGLIRTVNTPADGLPSGRYRIGVLIDRLGEQVETNKANNRIFRLDKWLAVGAARARAWELYW
ncbi:MAG: S8 family serine peptidase [Candidatus Sumerlaeia bacterium]|nr:S8 family serine peptidase [Candidatus Sumerlaeia bacterium]